MTCLASFLCCVGTKEFQNMRKLFLEKQWRNECSETLDEFGSLEQAEPSYFVAEVSSSDTQETLMTDLKIINL